MPPPPPKPAVPYSWAARPLSILRAGATPDNVEIENGDEEESDEGAESDAEAAAAAEKKAIEEGAAKAKALMDATDEFRAKQVCM